MTFDDKKLIVIAIIAFVTGLVVMIGFIGQGNVREFKIFFPEKIEQTVAFQDENGLTMETVTKEKRSKEKHHHEIWLPISNKYVCAIF